MTETTIWTLAEYLDRAEQIHLLQPAERAAVEAFARAWYYVLYQREDLPGHFSQTSSAAKALNLGLGMIEDRRNGRFLTPMGEEGGD